MTVKIRTLITLCALLGVLGISASSAAAAEPWWHLTSGSVPANLPPEGRGQIMLTAANLGDADANGATTPVTITDTLPEHMKAVSIGGWAGAEGAGARALAVRRNVLRATNWLKARRSRAPLLVSCRPMNRSGSLSRSKCRKALPPVKSIRPACRVVVRAAPR